MKSKSFIYAWFACLVIGLCFFTFVLLRPKQTNVYELDSPVQMGADYAGEFSILKGVSVQPGVWRVGIDYSSTVTENQKSIFLLRDSSLPERALRTMGMHTYAGLSHAEFDAYIIKETSSLEVYANTSGEELTITRVVFQETKLLWTRRLAIFLALMLLLVAIHKVYGRNSAVSTETKRIIALLIGIAAVASIPYYSSATINGGDLGYHIQRIDGVVASLRNGIFPVRIEPQWQQGYGYADAVFYCPLFLYLPALMRVVGFTGSEAYNFYCIFFTILTAVVSYYSFYRVTQNKMIGVLSSALYTLSFPRIHKLIICCQIGEGTAITFLPLIILGIWNLIFCEEEDRTYKSWLPFAVGYAGIIQSHVLSAEISFFITLIIFVVFSPRILKRKMLIPILKAVGIVLLLCCWYIVPFIDYYYSQDVVIKHVSERMIQARGNNLAHLMIQFWKAGGNVFFDQTGLKDSQPVGVGLFLIIVAYVFIVLWITGKLRNQRWLFAKCAMVASFVLLLASIHVFPWDAIQRRVGFFGALISSLQFPNRLLDWAIVFLVVVFGQLVLYFEEMDKQETIKWASTLVTLSVLTGSLFLMVQMMTHTGKIYFYGSEGYGTAYISGGEYKIYESNPDQYFYNRYQTSDGIKITNKKSGALRADFDVTTCNQDNWVEVSLVYYKGYEAVTDEGKLTVQSGDNAVCRVQIPDGYQGHVTVRFVSPWYWRLAEAVSAVSYFLGIGVICIVRRKNRIKSS